MAVYGWIILILQALLALFVIGLVVGPVIIAKVKNFKYSIQKRCEDEKLDINKRSDERKHRDEIKRQKDFELANKKLDAKLNKVDKQIKLQTKKLELAEKLKKQTQVEKSELVEQEEIREEIPEEDFNIPAVEETVVEEEKVEEIVEE